MALGGCGVNGIANIFPQTSQITSRELRLSFLTNNLWDELGISEIIATMFDYAQIDAMFRMFSLLPS